MYGCVSMHTYRHLTKTNAKFLTTLQEPQKNHLQGHLVFGLRGLSVLCLLQEEEEEHLGQGWWENFEIFYVVLIEPFVKFHHLSHIHVTSVPPVVKYRGG